MRIAGAVLTPWLTVLLCLVAGPVLADDQDWEFSFDDTPLPPAEELVHPEWFKLSFLNLGEDLADTVRAGKRGLILYFGQKDCAYCKAHLEKNWGQEDIVNYTRQHFEVVGINVRGAGQVTDFNGAVYKERAYALAMKMNFTPSLLFYDGSADAALRLTGYYPSYEFRAALEYVADRHYLKESFRDYLSRAEPAFSYGEEELNDSAVFGRPPYALDRSRLPAQGPLVVFFERRRCHACDVLHGGPLSDPRIIQRLGQFEVVQLDMWSNTPVLTPGGERLTAVQWAQKLGLFYAPTLVFFDERGKEIIRVDSVVRFFRLNNVLEYISSGGYREYATFQQWRRFQGR